MPAVAHRGFPYHSSVVGREVRGRDGEAVELVGRRAELEDQRRFLDRLGEGPVALGLLGPPGIGKTELLSALADAASTRGIRVVAARPAETEARVAHAGLRDLLVQLPVDAATDLPDPQAAALKIAVADEPMPGDARGETRALALRAAVLGVFERVARQGPVLVVVDDLHWLDPSTADLLSYAARRVQGPVGFAFARRPTDLAPDGPRDLGDPGVVVDVAGMDDDAVRALVRQRSERALDRSEVEHIVGVAAGNAFVAVELASAADRGQDLPDSLDALASARLSALDGDSIEVLRVASAAASPTVALLRGVLGDEVDVDRALSEAEASGAVGLSGGLVRFVHPIVRHATYVSMPAARRRSAHRRLADACRRPEERARHLALAAIGPDPAVAAALDEAASEAARRGAPAEAAELLELASQLDPAHEGDDVRRVAEAGHRLAAGDLQRTTALTDSVLEGGIPDAAGGRAVAARALVVRATVAQLEGDLVGAATRFSQVVDLTDDPQLRTSASLSLSFLLTNTGQLGAARSLIDRVERDAVGLPGPLDDALVATGVMVRYLCGEAIDWERLDGALAGGGSHASEADPWVRAPITSHPLLVGSLLLHMAGRLTEAASRCERLRAALRDDGDEAALALVDFWVAWIWGGLGHLDELEAKVAEAEERARAFDSPGRRGAASSAAATLAAWRGDDARCLGEVEGALAALGPASPAAVWAIAAAGLLELGRGDHEAALARYGPLVEVARQMGLHQATAAWWTPELVEVLTALDRPAEARALFAPYDLASFGQAGADARAVALRCAGLLASAEGDGAAGEAHLREALVVHAQGDSVLARARTELLLGTQLRRQGRRREALGILEAAKATFDAVGAAGWAGRARTELDRLGLRPQADGSPTPTELTVARLVGDGLTNKQVAARLHASPKTIEAHLTRIYRKVGVRGRAELAATVARHPERFSAP